MKGANVHLSFSGHQAEILPHPQGGWALEIAGLEQSHVDLEDPRRILHEYLRRMTGVLDALRPAGEPIAIAHLGGGALTLPRYVQATRPGSVQQVVEIERELPTFVMQSLPLPEGTQLEVIIGDAREQLAALPEQGLDALVLDVFTGEEESPAHLRGAAFCAEALSRLRPDGMLLVNVGDDAGQRFVRAQIRDLEEAAAGVGVPGVWTLTHAGLLEHPADGNYVLLAGGALQDAPAAAWRAAGPHPAAVLDPLESARL